MKKNNLIKDNRGFSLVELIVTLLVSSFVILAASFFLTASLSTFNRNNTEVSLQMESQIASNLIENLVVEATSCKYIPDFEYTVTAAVVDESTNEVKEGEVTGQCPVFLIGTSDGATSTLYIVILKNETHQLLLKKLTKPASENGNYINVVDLDPQTIKDTVSEAIRSKRPALLANYVTTFNVSPMVLTTETDEIVQLVIKLSYMDKTYDTSSNISLRNGVHR